MISRSCDYNSTEILIEGNKRKIDKVENLYSRSLLFS